MKKGVAPLLNGKIFCGGVLILVTLIVTIIIATGSLAWGYWQAGLEGAARWVVVFGIIWLVSDRLRWRWFPTVAMLLALLLAVFGIWFEFHPGWMFSGAAFALIAYDLGEFQLRLRSMPARDDIHGRTRRRILRVSILAGLGLAFISLFVFFTGKFSLDWGLFLIVVLLFASIQFLAWKNK